MNCNWNEMTSSQDSSDEEQQGTQQVKTQNTTNQTHNKEENKKEQVKTQSVVTVNKTAESHNQDKKAAYVSDQQLLVSYKQKKVDDAKAIKIVACHNQEMKDLIKNWKNTRLRQIKDGIYLMFFDQEEDLLQFIQQKITNRFRFYLYAYLKRKREDEEGGDRRRDEGRNREGEGDKRRDRKQYKPRREKNQQEKNIKDRQRDNHDRDNREKDEGKGKKVFLPKQNYQVQSNKNIVHIHNENIDTNKILEELQNRKIYKNFNKVILKATISSLQKVATIVNDIADKKKYYLDKEPIYEGDNQTIVELFLIQNGKQNKSKTFYHHFYPNTVKNAETKQNKTVKQPVRQQKSLKQKEHQFESKEIEAPHSRKLGSDFSQYFINAKTLNLSEIIKGFDENEYIKRLKEESATIQNNWKSWKIEAQQQNIQALLKLSQRLKKSTIYNVELKPSLRNERALLTAELKSRPQNQRRPKFDVSGVNGYLS